MNYPIPSLCQSQPHQLKGRGVFQTCIAATVRKICFWPLCIASVPASLKLELKNLQLFTHFIDQLPKTANFAFSYRPHKLNYQTLQSNLFNTFSVFAGLTSVVLPLFSSCSYSRPLVGPPEQVGLTNSFTMFQLPQLVVPQVSLTNQSTIISVDHPHW